MTSPPLAIACPAAFQPSANFATTSYGSGPYELKSLTVDTATLTLRSAWSGGPNGTTAAELPKTLVISQVANETTAANLLTTKQLDISQVSGVDVSRLLADKSLASRTVEGAIAGGVFFNGEAGSPAADQNVREALSLVIDRHAFVQAEDNGLSLASTGMIGPATSCYDPAATANVQAAESATLAAQLLTSDGYTLVNGKMTKNGQPLTVTMLGSPAELNGPQYVQAQWESLGVTVQLQDAPLTVTGPKLRSGAFDTWIIQYSNVQPALTQAATLWTGPSPPAGGNYSRFHDPDEVAAVAAATTATTDAARCTSWQEWEHLVLSRYEFVPLDVQKLYWFGADGVTFQPGIIIQPWSIRS